MFATCAVIVVTHGADLVPQVVPMFEVNMSVVEGVGSITKKSGISNRIGITIAYILYKNVL